MTIRVIREPSARDPVSGHVATIGVVFVNDRHFGFSCEDEIRETKVAGKTAIPSGRYRVTLTHSQKFGKVLPELHDVPGFTAIRIHAGNSAADSSGCLLFGMSRNGQRVTQSRMAVQAACDLIAASDEPCWIEIENPRGKA